MSAGTAKTGLDLLRVPFADNQINLLPKPYKRDSQKGQCKECGGYHGLPAVHLKYVGHAALTDRLLDADPNWTWEPLSLDNGLPALDRDGGMWIRLTVCGVTRLGYGDAQGKQGGDATKERIGDALRNAAMRFGCALDLWHKGDLHGVDEDDAADNPAARRASQPPPSTNGHHAPPTQPRWSDEYAEFRTELIKMQQAHKDVWPTPEAIGVAMYKAARDLTWFGTDEELKAVLATTATKQQLDDIVAELRTALPEPIQF